MPLKPTPRHPIARHHRLGMLAGLLLVAATLTSHAAPARAAAGDDLLGKWLAEAMEVDGKRYPVKDPMRIVFEFRRGGKFIATMSYKGNTKNHQGTWSVSGRTLTMIADGKTETMTYKVSGRSLRMDKRQGGKQMVHHMKRLP